MCTKVYALAQHAAHRWIGVCDHQAIHLAWDCMFLFLRPCDLHKLANTLSATRCELDSPAEGPVLYEIWIGNCALQLMRADYLSLRSLVWEAVARLPEEIPMATSTVPMRIAEKYEREETPFMNVWFSTN
ncbi:MAG: hypothetical protein Fur0022_47960 [Anaerolineales bacterium]